ncbi:MAG: CCA tRNA nucleotidyltransferase [Sneathiella sp.]|nr:CCA tRNA nucleotidyltransferase [Sneathiella sp.]
MPRAALIDIAANPPEWLTYPESLTLFEAVHSAGGEARFVGGCVRDAFFGKVSEDLDVCTDLHPGSVMELLQAAGFKVIPTGLDHGTITAVMGTRKFEVTTLRLDIETHGRRATVAFTKDFREDAARRDFTFNALSMDSNGRLYDYFGGVEDLKAGIVRFIGEPEERISEDYLRILRFFRFFARYGHGEPDREALDACKKARLHLSELSLERITMETKSLFSVPDPYQSILLMEHYGVRKALLPGKIYPDRFRKILSWSSDPLLRLVTLFGADAEWARQLSQYLRLSVQSQTFLEKLCSSEIDADLSERELKRLAYRRGVSVVRAQCLIFKTENEQVGDQYLGYLSEWNVPAFDVKGRDLLTLGVPTGPKVGQILKQLEEEWVNSDFSLQRSELLSKAQLLKP